MHVVTVDFKIKPDNQARCLEAIIAQAENSRQLEKECHQFDVSVTEKGQVHLYEVYTDENAFQRHLASKHFIEFDAKVGPWIEEKMSTAL